MLRYLYKFLTLILKTSVDIEMADEVQIKRQLIKVRNAVKRKLQMLKAGAVGDELMLSKTYAPITKGLEALKSDLVREIKTEPQTEDWINQGQFTASTPTKKIKKSLLSRVKVQPPSFATPQETFTQPIASSSLREETWERPARNESTFSTIGGDDSTMQESDETTVLENVPSEYEEYLQGEEHQTFLGSFDPITRYYVDKLFTDFTGNYNNDNSNLRTDKVYFDPEKRKLVIGTKTLTFLDNTFCLGRGTSCYKGSTGLYELMFPFKTSYKISAKNQQDYAAIKRISTPYNLRSMVGGRGITMNYNDKPIEFVYFDDPNELCDRLKLLIASQDAGNTNHANEIASILEELRELRIIA